MNSSPHWVATCVRGAMAITRSILPVWISSFARAAAKMVFPLRRRFRQKQPFTRLVPVNSLLLRFNLPFPEFNVTRFPFLRLQVDIARHRLIVVWPPLLNGLWSASNRSPSSTPQSRQASAINRNVSFCCFENSRFTIVQYSVIIISRTGRLVGGSSLQYWLSCEGF